MEGQEIRRKRLPREERERLILEEAVRFFAEVGFEGQTRALADRLGVTQPLLYRYFPDKDALIERVFDEVYLKHWDPEWDKILHDRSQPLVERMVAFYRAFCSAMFREEWVRIFMFAGLKGEAINARYLESVKTNILEPMVGEMRLELGLPSASQSPINDMEINMAWALHGAIFHLALRKWVYNLPVPENIDLLIECTVRSFMQGNAEAFRTLVKSENLDLRAVS